MGIINGNEKGMGINYAKPGIGNGNAPLRMGLKKTLGDNDKVICLWRDFIRAY